MCPNIDDNGILYLLDIAEKLRYSISRGQYLTDQALAQLFGKCERLTAVNVINCIHVSTRFSSWRCKTASYLICDALLVMCPMEAFL